MELSQVKKVVFLTGTRADFGKLKILISSLLKSENFEVFVFVTGMHMLSKYGNTYREVEKSGYPNIHKFINQNAGDNMDRILVKTISGFSDYIKEVSPHFIVVHGDRLEALSGAIVGSFNNILTGHIEGGEVSGTIDEIIRHSISKLCQIHFAANKQAKKRLLQLGELEDSIHVIGSPDMDIMNSKSLPSIQKVKRRYEINFNKYGIILFHSVTTELSEISSQVKSLVDVVINSKRNFVVIYPNNDPGSDIILEEYKRLEVIDRFLLYPSLRFEYFLTLLKDAQLIIGNSSAGIREAPYYGVPCINLGSRQNGRVLSKSVVNLAFDSDTIKSEIERVCSIRNDKEETFGEGNSGPKFLEILNSKGFWGQKVQKKFIDI